MEWDLNCNIGKLVVIKDLVLEFLVVKVKNSFVFSCNSYIGVLLIFFFFVVGFEVVFLFFFKVVMKFIVIVGESY